MIGDGINDALALSSADVGIAIGSGMDIAIDSADIVLVNSDLAQLLKLIKLSKHTIRNIKINLFWAFFYNILCIPLAFGLFVKMGFVLNPMIAGAGMSLSSLLVVLNALRLKNLDLNIKKTSENSNIEINKTSENTNKEINKTRINENNNSDIIKNDNEIEFFIENMACANCQKNIELVLNDCLGILEYNIDLSTKKVSLRYNKDFSFEDLKQKIEALSYKLTK